MIDFSTLHELTIPEGVVTQIAKGDTVLWQPTLFHYVSLGDSIAAGEAINDAWKEDYGHKSQYGVNINKKTAIVPGCYTDLIHKDLMRMYGNKVSTTSFARSGDTVANLLSKLDHDVVRKAIAKANIVTVCIGANDILGCVSGDRINEYVNTGSLAAMEADVEENLNILNTNGNRNSYFSLFNKLNTINPNAKYVFTTVYNPYKYLWIEEGADGFLKPLLDTIPTMEVFGNSIDGLIKDHIFSQDIVKQLFERFNNLSGWVEPRITTLNNILRTKITEYQATNPNFMLADTKTLFEVVPDRPYNAPKHYNDLVNVEFTRGYDTMKMDWGQLYTNNVIEGQNGEAISNTVCNDASSFWTTLVNHYIDGINIDWEGFSSTLVAEILNEVIMPDIDPHPEEFGQYVLSRSFEDVLDIKPLAHRTITYSANNGTGDVVTQELVGVDEYPSFTNISANMFSPGEVGYYYTKWNSSAEGNGITYFEGNCVGVSADMTLYAQWSNMYTVRVSHDYDLPINIEIPGVMTPDDHTGPMEKYALWIEGEEQGDLGAFSNPARVYTLHYNTAVGVIAQVESGGANSYIKLNGRVLTENGGYSKDARWGMYVTSNIDIRFTWHYAIATGFPQSYWTCDINTY